MKGRKRKFDEKTPREKLEYLLSCFHLAVSDQTRKRKTDVWGIAVQYGGRYNVTRNDFDLIRGLTIEELAKKIENSQ